MGKRPMTAGDRAIERHPVITKQEFRDAMSRLGAAVHVITTAGARGTCGYTGSAVCSVSDDPPTLLVCLNRSSAMNEVFKTNNVFCVNTLTAGQEELSNIFAGFTGVIMEDRFKRDRWDSLVTGSPALASALISLDCRIVSISEIGTHSVMFGEIVGARFGTDDGQALVYYKRAYHAV